jgi:hypothetical protein
VREETHVVRSTCPTERFDAIAFHSSVIRPMSHYPHVTQYVVHIVYMTRARYIEREQKVRQLIYIAATVVKATEARAHLLRQFSQALPTFCRGGRLGRTGRPEPSSVGVFEGPWESVVASRFWDDILLDFSDVVRFGIWIEVRPRIDGRIPPEVESLFPYVPANHG